MRNISRLVSPSQSEGHNGDGTVDGVADGSVEGTIDGTIDVTTDGVGDDAIDGAVDGVVDGNSVQQLLQQFNATSGYSHLLCFFS